MAKKYCGVENNFLGGNILGLSLTNNFRKRGDKNYFGKCGSKF